MYKHKVLESNGGGLHLFVFGVDGNIIFAHSGYECNRSQLTSDIEALRAGEDVTAWEGCADNPQELYGEFTPETGGSGWKLVADEKGLYPDNMGVAARIEFGVE